MRSGEESGIDLAAPSIGLARSDLVDPTIEDIEKMSRPPPCAEPDRDGLSLVRTWPRKREQCMVGAIGNEDPTMADEIRLNKPWLVAVWPGMGQVAISAGYYLMAKLGMHRLAEFSAEELFDVGHVDVKGGLIRTGRLPQSRLFVWNDPSRQRDLIVFIGEGKPPQGKYVFCRRLIESARQLGVERVFTFAAMATQMNLGDDSRVSVPPPMKKTSSS